MNSTLQQLRSRTVCAATARLLSLFVALSWKIAYEFFIDGRRTTFTRRHFSPTPPPVSPNQISQYSPGSTWIACWLQRAKVLG